MSDILIKNNGAKPATDLAPSHELSSEAATSPIISDAQITEDYTVARARALAYRLAGIARIALPVLTAAVALAVAANASLAVARLFVRLGGDALVGALASVASVGVLFGLLGVIALAHSNNLRALASIYLVAWLPLTMSLTGLEAALSSDLITLPGALATSGRTAAALLAGLALLPVLTLGAAAQRPQTTLADALAYYLGNALKLVLLVSTSAANLAFGLKRGVPLEVATFVAVVIETGFILALVRVTAQPVPLHAIALAIFGSAIALIAVETLGTLSGLATLQVLGAAGEALYLLTPALAIAYIIATALLRNQTLATSKNGVSEVTPSPKR